MKDATWTRETKIFWVLMEVGIEMWIKKRPHLSPTVYDNLWSFTDFKADMHNVYIKVRKYPTQIWTKLPFIMIDDAIYVVLNSWQPKWCTLDLEVRDKIVVQK